jgi:threonylcarbamoyladenosine tRNA methylthiotransferase MtaB
VKKRIAFQTFGCKLNYAETSAIARSFPAADYEVVAFHQTADVYVINSCSVTGAAEKTCRNAARSAKKRNPNAKVSMIGCFSQIKPEIVAAFPEVDLVLGNEDKFNIYHFIEHPDSERSTEVYNININKTKIFNPAYSSNDRTRTFLKIQDGCDYFCTYCSIPHARGRSRSASIAETIKIANEIGQSESREIILSGVNIGDFGRRNGETFLDFLLELEKVQGIDRIRISSVEPELLSHEIIDLVATTSKFQPHFHIPLQSGSNAVLQDMKRKYLREVYTDRVEYIKSKLPLACIAADIITGFPTETDFHFNETMEYLSQLPISYMHVFTYSERENTKAILFENKVSPKQKKFRSEQLHILSDKKKRDFYNLAIQTDQEVLFEAQNQGGMMSGWTGNYIKVITPFDENLVNTIQKVRLEKMDQEGNFVWKSI